jgi:hypothetical protein
MTGSETWLTELVVVTLEWLADLVGVASIPLLQQGLAMLSGAEHELDLYSDAVSDTARRNTTK